MWATRACVAGATLVGVAVLATGAGADSSPAVVGLSAQRGHVVVAAQFGAGQGPYIVEIARAKTMYATGFPKRFVVVREALPQTATGLVHYRTRGIVRPGRYWVAVAAHLLDATSCQPILHGMDCNVQWSHAVAVRVR